MEDKTLELSHIATQFGVINLRVILNQNELEVTIENLQKDVEILFDMFYMNKKTKKHTFKVNIDEYINDDKYL
jgi:hypothetical protein